MKKGLSAIEIRYLVSELKELEGSKVAKIFQPQRNEVYIQFYSAKTGKRMLRIIIPGFIFLTDFKEESPQRPHGFLQSLRKWLEESRLKEIKQDGFERIVEFHFETNEGEFLLIVELFARGNMVLCKADKTIVACLESHKYKDRDIKPKSVYAFPKSAVDASTLTKAELMALAEKTEKDAASFLAAEIGLGGIYAEEICAKSGTEKSKKLDKADVEKVHKFIKELLNTAPKPQLITDPAFDAVPFDLSTYNDSKKEYFQSYNEALSRLLTTQTLERRQKDGKPSKERERLKKILDSQMEVAEVTEKEIIECQKKAEIIYEHYLEIKEILDGVKKLTKDQILKNYAKVTEVDLKNKTLILKV